jgi:hypothetical protein
MKKNENAKVRQLMFLAEDFKRFLIDTIEDQGIDESVSALQFFEMASETYVTHMADVHGDSETEDK